MRQRYSVLCVLAACATLPAGSQQSNGPADTATVTASIERAHAAAGTQWAEAEQFFCGRDSARANRPDDPVIEPTRVFDNLYAIGRTSTVVWVVTTRDGVLLIDAGYPDQVESVLLPGLRALKLDAADVKYVLIAHGHADHFGGASYFQQRGARVALSAADWDLVEAPAPAGAPAPPPGALPPPRRDVIVDDGKPIVFGGLSITPVSIPGHTPGALGFVFEVEDGPRTHVAALFGGSILLSGRMSDDGLKQYVQSIARFAAVTRALGVDVEIQNHPLYDGFLSKLDGLRRRGARDEHPFVVGRDGYQRFLTVMSECASAQLARR